MMSNASSSSPVDRVSQYSFCRIRTAFCVAVRASSSSYGCASHQQLGKLRRQSVIHHSRDCPSCRLLDCSQHFEMLHLQHERLCCDSYQWQRWRQALCQQWRLCRWRHFGAHHLDRHCRRQVVVAGRQNRRGLVHRMLARSHQLQMSLHHLIIKWQWAKTEVCGLWVLLRYNCQQRVTTP